MFLQARFRLLLLALGLRGSLLRGGVLLLNVFQLLLHCYQLGGNHFRSLVVLGGLLRVLRRVRQLQCTLGLRLVVLLRLNQAVHLHLQLGFMANDFCSVIRNLLVLLLRSLNGLLDLHLRISVLINLLIEGTHHVLPALAEGVSHYLLLWT